MAKKTISVSLEEDLIAFIDNFREEKDLSSRSAALERMLLEMQFNKKQDIKKIVYEILKENNFKIDDLKIEQKDIPAIDKNTVNSINDAFSNMPD